MFRTLVILASGLSGSSVLAAPLEFGGITAETHVLRSPEVACRELTQTLHDCRLARPTFGSVPIERSMFTYNSAFRPNTLSVEADALFIDTAVEVLTARYGPPASDEIRRETDPEGGHFDRRLIEWPAFDNEASLRLFTTRGGRGIMLFFRWAENIPPREAPPVDF